jgi:hypothetical protein
MREPDDVEGEFLLLGQSPAKEQPASRPWSRCTSVHRIWAERRYGSARAVGALVASTSLGTAKGAVVAPESGGT